MTGTQLALTAGALVSLGLVLAVLRLLPADPNLADVIDRLSPTHPRRQPTDSTPVTGGTDLMNALRNDDARESTDRGAGTGSFPRAKKGFNEVPAVFE